eukprot:scaffold160910_cov25-Tisochrysis_lutea.AAC.2
MVCDQASVPVLKHRPCRTIRICCASLSQLAALQGNESQEFRNISKPSNTKMSLQLLGRHAAQHRLNRGLRILHLFHANAVPKHHVGLFLRAASSGEDDSRTIHELDALVNGDHLRIGGGFEKVGQPALRILGRDQVDLVEDEHDALRSEPGNNRVLEWRAPAAERIASVEHFEQHVRLA